MSVFIMGIPILVRQHIYTEAAPRVQGVQMKFQPVQNGIFLIKNSHENARFRFILECAFHQIAKKTGALGTG